MNLEDRLRAELDRSGRATNVGAAPSIDELATTADARQRRNRSLGTGMAMLLGGGVLFGAFLSTIDNSTTVEVTNVAAAEEEQAAEIAAQELEDQAPAEIDEPVVQNDVESERESSTDDLSAAEAESDPADQDDDGDAADETASVSADAAAPELDLAFAQGAALLQADDGAVTVETRKSAVGLASASGVLVQSDGSGGYVGLAVSFGESTTPLSLSSPNGLDWTSTDLVGVPAGATASVLREHGGTYVALFERFDSDSGVKQFLIGTSADTVTWDVSPPLAGGEVYATDLAVGSPGVIVIGDNESPQVWSGPIGGPYTRTSRLDSRALYGVTTVGGQFVVAGRSAEGVAVFTSTDATTWSTTELSSGVGPAVSVADGTITMRNLDDSTTLISSDAGATWSSLPAATSRGVTVSNSTMGFLGGDAAGAVVAVADGNTFSSADLDVAAPDRLSLVAAGNSELVMVQTTESGGTTWIVAQR